MIVLKSMIKLGALAVAASLGSLMVFSDNPSVPPRTPRNNEKRARGPGTAAAINEHYDADSGIDWPARARFKADIAAVSRATLNQLTSVPHRLSKGASGLVMSERQPSASPPPTDAEPYSNCIIITLRRDDLRVEHVRNQTKFDFPGATISWAIDGKNVTDDQIAAWQKEGYLASSLYGFMDPKKPIGKPKISCLMSHVRVWEQLAQEPAEDAFYFILEDDTSPSADFHSRYPAVLAELSGLTWDWVYLAIHPTWARGNTRLIPGKELINRAPRMVGNAGYLISKRGATKILAKMFPVKIPKDQAIRILVKQGDLEAYIVKTELIRVMGQQGRGFNRSLSQDASRTFESNIWDK